MRAVIVGSSSDHEAIVEPLIETRPDVGDAAAGVAFSFEGWGRPLGIEGAVLSLKATDSEGTVVLDRMVDGAGDLELLPPGDYTLTAYYRSCDGSCSVLDPANDFCSIEATFEADDRYRLTVAADGCTLR